MDTQQPPVEREERPYCWQTGGGGRRGSGAHRPEEGPEHGVTERDRFTHKQGVSARRQATWGVARCGYRRRYQGLNPDRVAHEMR
ncbi:hypothetical protein C0Q70_19031 [Pomacea canaliculata]|uniref:Uncharacterized protein n=1 Tax=Pomacea canaliculata TaxID=400727 RepID=A0A2T7NI65_POMCA|nr:hypothetical protein C0Q70_19031 [Pomacea canaliculata]